MAKSVGVLCPRGRVLHADCQVCALDPMRPCHLTPDILEELRTSERDLPPNAYTPTMLLNCDRQDVLRSAMPPGDYYQDIEDAWSMIRGSMIHARLEQCPSPNNGELYIREVRFHTVLSTAYGDVTFAGKPDLVIVQRVERGVAYVKIVDYKSSGEIGHDKLSASNEHQMQINMYAFLVERELPYIAEDFQPETSQDDEILHVISTIHTVKIAELEILYCDMKKTRRFTSAGPLEAKGKMISRSPKEYETIILDPIHLIPSHMVEAWVVEAIERKLASKQPNAPLPPVLPYEKQFMCPRCAVRDVCAQLAEQEQTNAAD